MIVDFSVENFGAIKDRQTLSFVADNDTYLEDYYVLKAGKYRLLKFMFLYGANASGKSTVLQALDFLRNLMLKPMDDKGRKLEFSPYLFDEESRFKDSQIEVRFIANEELYRYNVVFNRSCVVSESLKKGGVGKPKTIFSRVSDRDKQLSIITFNKDLNIKSGDEELIAGNTLWNSSTIAGYLKTNMFVEDLHSVSTWFIGYMSSLITPRTDLTQFVTNHINGGKIEKDFVLSILKQADFNIRDIVIDVENMDMPDNLLKFLMSQSAVPERVKQSLTDSNSQLQKVDLKFIHQGDANVNYELSFEQESLGTHRYYGLAGILALMYDKTSLFCIDELESSLHPDLFRHFILLVLQNIKSSQCVVTTHNREIMGDKSLFRNDAMWITDKQDGCDTKLYSLSHFDSSVIRNTSSVLNAYKAGRLGGTPDLGDTYIEMD